MLDVGHLEYYLIYAADFYLNETVAMQLKSFISSFVVLLFVCVLQIRLSLQ